MVFRKATASDLPQVKAIFVDITNDLIEKNIPIWDEIYPVEFFADDIEKGELYLLTDGDILVGAFALCDGDAGESAVDWKISAAKPLYLNRLGVNLAYLRQGVGGWLMKKAFEVAKELGADAVRLFVVDYNVPAIKLYDKCGMTKANGVYVKHQQGVHLTEYGYEIKLTKVGLK